MASETKPTRKKEKERVQLDFSPESLERLDELKERTGATTRAETIRQALRLYEWFVDEVDPESTIQVIDKDNEMIARFKARLLHNATRPN